MTHTKQDGRPHHLFGYSVTRDNSWGMANYHTFRDGSIDGQSSYTIISLICVWNRGVSLWKQWEIIFTSSSSSPITTERRTATDIILRIEQGRLTSMKHRKIRYIDVMLPEDFVPGPYTVIIDRRKKVRQAPGNQYLWKIAKMFLDDYARAPNKPSKSRIVSTISQMLDNSCPEGGAFVRLGRDNRWYAVPDCVATEKIGYTMRELLGNQYRSSSAGKKRTRL